MSPPKIITSLFLCSQMSVQDGRWCHRNAPARGIVACESLLRLAQSVRPGQNKDPDYENQIQTLARRRFLKYNRQDQEDMDDEDDHDVSLQRNITYDGIMKRKMYIRPEVARVRRGHGRCARGGVCQARGRGRGQAVGRVSTPTQSQRGGVRRVRGQSARRNP